MQKKGAVFKIIDEASKLKSGGSNVERTKILLKMRLTTQTGLSMTKFGPDTLDNQDEIEKILTIIRSPIIGLPNFNVNLN